MTEEVLSVHDKKIEEFVLLQRLAMKNIGLREDLQYKIGNFLHYTKKNHDDQQELKQFFELLPPSLEVEVCRTIFKRIASANDIFSDNAEFIEFIVNDVEIVLYTPEDIIIG